MSRNIEEVLDIDPVNRGIVSEILQKYVPQYEVWAFGSRITKKARQYSDLDLAIISESPMDLSLKAALNEAFSESDLPWQVDVIDWATTQPAFREIIEIDKVIFQQAQK